MSALIALCRSLADLPAIDLSVPTQPGELAANYQPKSYRGAGPKGPICFLPMAKFGGRKPARPGTAPAVLIAQRRTRADSSADKLEEVEDDRGI